MPVDHLAIVASGGAGLNVLASGDLPKGALALGISTDAGHASRVRKERGVAVHLSSLRELDGWEHVEPAVASHFLGTMPPAVRGAFTRKIVLHITGLGGVTGSSVSKALCRLRSGVSRSTLHLAMIPFSVERQRHARALEDAAVMGTMSAVVHFPNDLVARASPDRPFQESMLVANLLVLEVARGLASVSAEVMSAIACERGNFIPVLGAGPSISSELLASFGAESTKSGYLVAAPGSDLGTVVLEEMGATGITVTCEESSGIAPGHWLGLLRST